MAITNDPSRKVDPKKPITESQKEVRKFLGIPMTTKGIIILVILVIVLAAGIGVGVWQLTKKDDRKKREAEMPANKEDVVDNAKPETYVE